MNRKEIDFLLQEVTSNCEYLTNVRHGSHHRHLHDIDKTEDLCAISVARVMIQASYLLYTCFTFREDVYLSVNPAFVRTGNKPVYQAILYFYLAEEESQWKPQLECNNCNFMLFKASRLNSDIMGFLQKIFLKTEHSLAEKPLQQLHTKLDIVKFIQFLRQKVEPQILQKDRQISAIKYLETHQLFARYSDLLNAYRSSLLYRIKSKPDAVEHVRLTKRKSKELMLLAHLTKNEDKIYKQMDQFLLFLIRDKVISMEKSTSQTPPSNKMPWLIVGDIIKQTISNHQRRKYFAKLYLFEKKLEDKSKSENQKTKNIQDDDNQEDTGQKNIYTLQYYVENSTLLIKYITNIEINIDTTDFMSIRCSNIAFQDPRISFQINELIQKSSLPKKHLCFKVTYYIQQDDVPFIKVLIALEYVTICAKAYFRFLTKRPYKNQLKSIAEEKCKLNHLYKLFVEKAQNFYTKL